LDAQVLTITITGSIALRRVQVGNDEAGIIRTEEIVNCSDYNVVVRINLRKLRMKSELFSLSSSKSKIVTPITNSLSYIKEDIKNEFLHPANLLSCPSSNVKDHKSTVNYVTPYKIPKKGERGSKSFTTGIRKTSLMV